MDMRYLRERAKLRAVDVASLIGVGESSVRNWEKGRTDPRLTINQVLKLCEIYQCSLSELDQASKISMGKMERNHKTQDVQASELHTSAMS